MSIQSGQYVIVRSRDQGCMCGTYVSHTGREVTLNQARQIYSWEGERLTLVDFSVIPGDCRLSRPSSSVVIMLEACGIIVPNDSVAEFLKTKEHG